MKTMMVVMSVDAGLVSLVLVLMDHVKVNYTPLFLPVTYLGHLRSYGILSFYINCTCTHLLLRILNNLRDNILFCTLIDVDECLLRTDTCGDRSTASCINTIGSYKCMCLTGYTGDEGNCSGKPLSY